MVRCRVVLAQQALLVARTTPSTHMGRAILQDVYFPGGDYSGRLRSMESYHRLRRAMQEVRQRSWWSGFKARTSWLLHPTEVSSFCAQIGSFHKRPLRPPECVLQAEVFTKPRVPATGACPCQVGVCVALSPRHPAWA